MTNAGQTTLANYRAIRDQPKKSDKEGWHIGLVLLATLVLSEVAHIFLPITTISGIAEWTIILLGVFAITHPWREWREWREREVTKAFYRLRDAERSSTLTMKSSIAGKVFATSSSSLTNRALNSTNSLTSFDGSSRCTKHERHTRTETCARHSMFASSKPCVRH